MLAQNDPDLEYMVIDGGSTDGSIDVLRSFGERVQWTSQRDRGQADAINQGLRRSTGSIVSWLNSDDLLEAGALSQVRQCMAEHPEAAFIYGRAWVIDETGRRVREFPTFKLTRNDLSRTCSICQPATFIRRSAMERFGVLNDRLHLCMDYEWWLRMSQSQPMAFCDGVLASIRQYGTTKTEARRLRALIEAGYLLRHHYGRASWRWSAKWMAHRMKRNPWSALALPCSALRYRRRFDSALAPSRYGERLLKSLS